MSSDEISDDHYWDEFNPWRGKLVYVTLKELAHCVEKHDGIINTSNGPLPYDDAWIIKHWQQGGRYRLDAYIILAQPSGEHSIGVRFGKRAEEYYSPMAHNRRTSKVLAKYLKNK